MIAPFNRLKILAFYRGTTTLVPDIAGDLDRASRIEYETLFPFGRYGPASFFVPRDPDDSWSLAVGQRIVIYNGVDVVYEGYVRNIDYATDAGEPGRLVTCVGGWADIMEQGWALEKPWADNRMDDQRWVLQTGTTGNGDQAITADLQNRIRFTPKHGLLFASGDYIARRYTAPTGQTVKRITLNYDMSEQAVEEANKVFHYDSAGPTYTDLTATYDGSLTAGSTLTFTTGDYLYTGARTRDIYYGVKFTMGGTVNAVASVMTAEYWNGSAWTALTITDGTASGGKCWAQSGDVTFTQPADWAETSVNGTRAFWVRFLVSVNLTASTVINELRIMQNQAWEIAVRNVGTSADVVSVTTTSTGATDHTLATPSQSIELRFYSRAQQYGVANGTVYGQWSSITVYTETGSINLTEIAKDVRSFVTDINSDEARIASNTYTLEPFITNGQEPVGRILQRAAAYGDSSLNQWGVELWASDWAGTPNGEPVLVVDQYPALTSFEYVVRERENQFRVTQNGEVYNWIVVRYRNALGQDVYYTPDDDATLRDDNSVSTYGRRVPPGGAIDTGQSSLTTAVNWGKRFLAAYKNPSWSVSGPITVVGAIQTKEGLFIPAANASARARVQIANFLLDELAISGAGLTFIITHTKYVHDTQTLSLTVGVPDDLAVFLAQQRRT